MCWLLYSDCLREFKLNKDAYTKLFSDTYEYALLSEESLDLPIGNIMRQLLEAFSTFNFRVGIEQLVTRETVLKELPEDIREHYRNLVYKIVLNGGSHTQDQIQINPISVLEPLYSFEEKRRIARELICLLYVLNPNHVVSYLGDYANAVKTREVEQNINIWLDVIRQQ